MKPNFRYSTAAETRKEGYLRNKWNRLYPGWNKPPKAPEKGAVCQFPRAKQSS